MASDTIVLFGAGATKACGGPLTNEILPEAFQPVVRPEIEREYYIDLLDCVTAPSQVSLAPA